jgi:tripeptide aminopeptidase
MVNQSRLLQRFLRYVEIDTTAVDDVERYPSSAGQLELGRLLVSELLSCGVVDAAQDDNGIVTGIIPANNGVSGPTVAFNAHLDTSPETTGRNVKPQVIKSYQGGDIPLPGNPACVIRVADNPALDLLHGCTLVTTDGNTLLGGDDKAGLAAIMELADTLFEHPDILHGPIRILFTCDEEIGRGADFVDVPALQATAAYTLDGPGADQIDVETFSGDMATITVNGVNIHPSIGKGRMVNAIRAAAEFVTCLPQTTLSPETTDGRQGFQHPYRIEGDVANATIHILLRDFETEVLKEYADGLRQLAKEVEATIPGCSIAVDIRLQYRNMREGLNKEPRAVEYARIAHERLGRQPHMTIIRGGTDGSHFTTEGLPTPNLSVGQHNLHSPLEWACLDEMAQATSLLVELVQVWAEEG